MNWNIKHQLKSEAKKDRLKEIKEILFLNRGLDSEQKQTSFLNPEYPSLESLLETLPDLNQKDLAKAVGRIKKAIDNQEPIVIYGDYDCDGVCSTAILWRTLFDLKAKVRPFIPHRIDHGYGLSEKGIKEILENPFLEGQKPLVITVDNGISAVGIASSLKDQKIDLIITDHHTPPKDLPNAFAIVHTTKLSGSGVAWLLSSALKKDPSFLGLAALGTVCDLLPLTEANRQIVTHGIKDLRNTSNPGLRALYQASGIGDALSITAHHLGFLLGPRINAVGRLGHALDALRLLCTTKVSTALDLAQKLSFTNADRQDLTYKFSTQAIEHFSKLPSLPNLLFLESPDYHEGVIGLIASRLVEHFHRPSIVVSLNKDLAKASARSIGPINITELIAKAKDHLLGYGGHHGAAGFSVHPDNLAAVKELLGEEASVFDPSLFVPSLDIELELSPSDIDFTLLQLVEELSPFGIANPRPLFATSLEVMGHKIIGKDKTHLKVTPASPFQSLDLIGFGLAARVTDLAQKTQFAFTLDRNFFNGRTSLQLLLKDFAPASYNNGHVA